MRALLDRLSDPLHLLIASAGTWLVLTSPWIGMYIWIPEEPGVFNLSHVLLGFAMLPLALVYTVACLQGGRWRNYFPWLAGELRGVGADVAGIFRGVRPMSEGAGLFALIDGLLLLALLTTSFTGIAWFFVPDTDLAATWRGHHVIAARSFAVLMLLHVVSASLHLLDLVRD